MAQPTDDSVQIALATLREIEETRIEEETRAERARAQATEAERQRRIEARLEREREAARQAEREAAIAREEAKLNVQAQVAARTAESQRTLESMQAELQRIQAERALIHQRMLSRAHEPRTQATGRHWPVVAGLFGTVASILAVLLFVQATGPAPQPEIIVREVPVPIAAAQPEEPAPAPEPEPVAEPEEVTQPTRTPRPRPRPPRPVDVLGSLDDCGDDPLCGLER